MGMFECDRCGKCCGSLGSLITIERRLNDRDYYCRCKIDNAIFLAHVDPVFQEEIADEFAVEGSADPSHEKKLPVSEAEPKGRWNDLCNLSGTA